MAMEDNSLPVSWSAKSKKIATGTTLSLQQKIRLETFDGMECEVELGTAMMCPLLAREVMHQGTGSSSGASIILPKKVRGIVLNLIIEYCLFHQLRGHSNKEQKLFHQKFIKLDRTRLVDLFNAAHSLGMDHLEDLAIEGLVRMLSCMTPEKIRETLRIPESERPTEDFLLKATFDAKSHLFVTKRMVVQEQKKQKDAVEAVGQSSSPENGNLDDKSLEDLVLLIDRKEGSKSKSRKKRNKKKYKQAKDSSMAESTGKATQSTHSAEDSPSDQHTDIEEENKVIGETDGAQNGGVGYDQEELNFDDSLDPVDREVMEFKRLLSISWLDRRQEIFTLANSSKENIKVIGEIDGAQNGGVGYDLEELHFDDSLDPVEREVMEFERLLSISWLDRRQEILTLANCSKEKIKVITAPPPSLNPKP